MGDISMKDLLVGDGLTDAFNHYHMGMTAENIANALNISRLAQDNYAFRKPTESRSRNRSGQVPRSNRPCKVTAQTNRHF